LKESNVTFPPLWYRNSPLLIILRAKEVKIPSAALMPSICVVTGILGEVEKLAPSLSTMPKMA
jgi:hypothetical protein